MQLKELIKIFEDIDVSQGFQLPGNYGVKGEVSQQSINQLLPATYQQMYDLKSRTRYLNNAEKLIVLSQLNQTVPQLPTFGTGSNLRHNDIAQVYFRGAMDWYNFVQGYQQYLAENIKAESREATRAVNNTLVLQNKPVFDLSKYPLNVGSVHPYCKIKTCNDAFYCVYEGASGVNRYQYFKVPTVSNAGKLCADFIEKYYKKNEKRYNESEDMQAVIEACKLEAVEKQTNLPAFLKYWQHCFTEKDKLAPTFHSIYHSEALKDWYTVQLQNYASSLEKQNGSEAAKQAEVGRWKLKLAESIAKFLKDGEAAGGRLGNICYDHAEQLINFYEWLTGNYTREKPGKTENIVNDETNIGADVYKTPFEAFKNFMIEVETLDLKAVEYYLVDGQYIEVPTPKDEPGLPLKTVMLLDLSSYRQNNFRYENRLRRAERHALHNLFMLDEEQIKRQLTIITARKGVFDDFFEVYSNLAKKFAEGTLSVAEVLMTLNTFFIIADMPEPASITSNFIEDLQSAAMLKQRALLTLEVNIKKLITGTAKVEAVNTGRAKKQEGNQITTPPQLFAQLFKNPNLLQPCLSLLMDTDPPAINEAHEYMGNSKGVFIVWLLALQKKAMLKDNFRTDKQRADTLNLNFPGLDISESLFRQANVNAKELYSKHFEAEISALKA